MNESEIDASVTFAPNSIPLNAWFATLESNPEAFPVVGWFLHLIDVKEDGVEPAILFPDGAVAGIFTVEMPSHAACGVLPAAQYPSDETVHTAREQLRKRFARQAERQAKTQAPAMT